MSRSSVVVENQIVLIVSQYKCGYCDRMGHNAAGCPVRKVEAKKNERYREDVRRVQASMIEKHAGQIEYLKREAELLWDQIRILYTMVDIPRPPQPKQTVMFDF